MNHFEQTLTEELRHELAEYGELLRLFEEQQRSLFDHDAGGVLRLSGCIESQVVVLTERRRHREQAVIDFAVKHGQPADATLRSLLPFCAEAVRPLLEALISEVNVLIHRVRRATRHNHTLLARAVESRQEILAALRPDSYAPTYAANGRRVAPGTVRPALQAAG